MDLEWHADILIPERMITVITGPPQVVIDGLDYCRGTIRRYPLLYLCSNFSRVLPELSRTVTGFSVRRGFTGDQVSTIIGGCDATYLFVEHDPSLYEDDTRLIPVVVNKIRAFAHQNGTVIVYSESTDRFMRQVMRAAHRVYIYAEWGELIRRRMQRQRLQGHDRGFRSHQARLVAFARPAEEDQGCGKDAITRAGREHVYGCLTGEDRSDQWSPADRDEARTSYGDFSGAWADD
jgi:hypothetical protein